MLKPPVPTFVRIEPRLVCLLSACIQKLDPPTWPANPDGLRRYTIHMADVHHYELDQYQIDGITNA